MWSPAMCSTNLNGPVPIGFFVTLGWLATGETLKSVRRYRASTLGCLKVTTTSWPLTVACLTAARLTWIEPALAGVREKLMESATSCGVIGLPSWNLTPWRIVIVTDV